MPEHPDLSRLRQEYAARAQGVELTDRYSLFNPVQLFIVQQRQRVLLKALLDAGMFPLAGKRILELGSGSGGVLLELLSAGANPGRLHGAELLLGRLQKAHQSLRSLPLLCADGRDLPYAAQSFDLVMQFTVFSSVLDPAVRVSLANEMLRVLRPGGVILWYDFWLNPTNSQTRGIRPAEIRSLFPGCHLQYHKITLAPPLARHVVPISWGLASILEWLGIFNTHYLVLIRPVR